MLEFQGPVSELSSNVQLSWECLQHVAGMSATDNKVGHFWLTGPFLVTPK